jgi:hypothetical protein
MGRTGGLGHQGRGMLPSGRGPKHNRMPGTPKASKATRDADELIDSPAPSANEPMTNTNEANKVAGSWAAIAKLGEEDIAKRPRMAERVANFIMGDATAAEAETAATTTATTATAATTTMDTTTTEPEEADGVPTVEQTTTATQGLEEIQQPPTPPRMKIRPTLVMAECAYYTYFDLKMPLDMTGRLEPVFEALGTFIQRVQELDDNACLFPYLAKDRRNAHVVIKNTEDWQQVMGRRRLTTLRQYFQSVGAFGRDGTRTMQVLIGTTSEPQDLITNLGEFLRPAGQRYWTMYAQKIQAERTKVIGWLYMSTKNINKDTLRDEIQKVVGFPVGLMWRVITPANKEEGQQDNEEVRAIHVIVDDANYASDTEVLSAMYCSDRTEGWPMGIRMRFVQDADNAMGLEDPENLEVMRGRQAYHLVPRPGLHFFLQRPSPTPIY